MPNLQQYVAAIGAFQGLLMLVLLPTARRVSQASRLLGVICLILSLMFGLSFLLTARNEALSLHFAGWLFYLPASLGGLIYLYCRNALLDQPLVWRDALHGIPLLICYVLVFDFLVLQPETLVRWIQGTPIDSWRIALAEIVMVGQGLVYLPLAIGTTLRLKRRAPDEIANFHPATFTWLLVFTITLLFAWVLKAIFALSNVASPYSYSFAADILLVSIIYIISAAQWRHPKLFNIQQLVAVTKQRERKPRETALLDDSTRAELFDIVVAAVESQQLFRDSSLTLSRLAQTTGLSTHHISEALNRHAGKNFYEFVNTYRVEYVCERLRDTDEKLLDIALEAGFASKSTFNAIFKQYTSMTPSQYRRDLDAGTV